jgi:hypothetical protein
MLYSFQFPQVFCVVAYQVLALGLLDRRLYSGDLGGDIIHREAPPFRLSNSPTEL